LTKCVQKNQKEIEKKNPQKNRKNTIFKPKKGGKNFPKICTKKKKKKPQKIEKPQFLNQKKGGKI